MQIVGFSHGVRQSVLEDRALNQSLRASKSRVRLAVSPTLVLALCFTLPAMSALTNHGGSPSGSPVLLKQVWGFEFVVTCNESYYNPSGEHNGGAAGCAAHPPQTPRFYAVFYLETYVYVEFGNFLMEKKFFLMGHASRRNSRSLINTQRKFFVLENFS